MEIKIEEICEFDDGSAQIFFTADSEAMKMLASEGLLTILRRELENVKEHNERSPISKDTDQKDIEECIAEAADV